MGCCQDNPLIEIPITIGTYPILDVPRAQQNSDYSFPVSNPTHAPSGPSAPILQQPRQAQAIRFNEPSAPPASTMVFVDESEREPFLLPNGSTARSDPVPPYPTDGLFHSMHLFARKNFEEPFNFMKLISICRSAVL